MDPDSHVLVLAAVNESQYDSLANQKKLSSTSSIEERELLQQLPQATPAMLTNTSTLDGVAAAVPLSHNLTNEFGISAPKEKNGSSSRTGKLTPKSRKRNRSQEDTYNKDIWECVPRERSNGKVDKYYHHKIEKFMCRSMKEIERYEATGIRPAGLRGKIKKKESIGEVVKKIGDSETEEISLAMKRREEEKMRIDVEKFLADARYNLLHLYDGQQHHSKGTSCTSNISILGRD